MGLGWSTSVKSLSKQSKDIHRLHVIFGAMLMVTTLALAATTSVGSQIFRGNSNKTTSTRTSSTFDQLDATSPLPLLMSQSGQSVTKVAGKEITKVSFDDSSLRPPATTLSNNFIRSFAFASTDTNELTVSWNIGSKYEDLLYVIKQSESGSIDDDDLEVFSIEGRDLEISTHSFSVETPGAYLYLNIFELDDVNGYTFVERSAIVSDSK